MGASRACTPENGGYVVAVPCRGGDNGLAADRDTVCDDCDPPFVYDCGVSTGLLYGKEERKKKICVN